MKDQYKSKVNDSSVKLNKAIKENKLKIQKTVESSNESKKYYEKIIDNSNKEVLEVEEKNKLRKSILIKSVEVDKKLEVDEKVEDEKVEDKKRIKKENINLSIDKINLTFYEGSTLVIPKNSIKLRLGDRELKNIQINEDKDDYQISAEFDIVYSSELSIPLEIDWKDENDNVISEVFFLKYPKYKTLKLTSKVNSTVKGESGFIANATQISKEQPDQPFYMVTQLKEEKQIVVNIVIQNRRKIF